MSWYYRKDDRQIGPLGFDQLRQLVSTQVLLAGDFVRSGRDPQWHRADEVPELQEIGFATRFRPEIVDNGGADDRQVKNASPASNRIAEQSTVDPPGADSAVTPSAGSQVTSVDQPPEVTDDRNDADASQWYCQVQGDIYGPVATETLEEWMAAGRVGPTDLIRLGQDGEWQSAALIGKLLAAPVIEASTSSAAEGILADAAFRRARHLADRDDERGRIEVGELMSAGTERLKRAVSGAIALAQRFSTILLIVFGVASVVIGGGIWLTTRVTYRSIYHDYVAIWNRLEADTSDSTLTQESQRLQSALTYLVAEVDDEDVAGKYLLWAGRDYLQPMVNTGELTPDAADAFRKHMQFAAEALNEDEDYWSRDP